MGRGTAASWGAATARDRGGAAGVRGGGGIPWLASVGLPRLELLEQRVLLRGGEAGLVGRLAGGRHGMALGDVGLHLWPWRLGDNGATRRRRSEHRRRLARAERPGQCQQAKRAADGGRRW